MTVSFVHITDLHLGHSPGMVDTEANLAYVVDAIEALTRKPHFIIASGDLVDKGSPESYRVVQRQLARLGRPVFYALGNHDIREAFYAEVLGRENPDAAPYFYDTVIEGIHLVVLDSSSPGEVGGTIEEEQFMWLEGRIKAHPELPKLIISHHPPAVDNVPDRLPFRTIDFAQSQRLAEILRGHNLLGILSGHIHYDGISMWHGIPVIIGTGLHTAVDMLFEDGVRVVRGASFTTCSMLAHGLSVAFQPLPADRVEIRRIMDRDR